MQIYRKLWYYPCKVSRPIQVLGGTCGRCGVGSVKSVRAQSHPRQSAEEILGIRAELKCCVSLSPCVPKVSISYLSGVPYRKEFSINQCVLL